MLASHILRKYDPAHWGGTETAVQRLVQGLQHHGISSMVHAPHCATSSSSDPLSDAGARVQRYKAFVPVAGISAAQREALVSWGGNLFSFELFWQLRSSGADVMHSHALNRIAGISLMAARSRGVPHAITLHGGALDIPEEVNAKLTAPLKGGFEWGKTLGALVRSRHALGKTDAIFTCNPKEAALLQEKYPHQRIIVQPHSVPAAQYAVEHRAAALQAFPQIAGRDLIVKVARLDPAKNLPWLVRQMPAIKRRHPRAMLVLIGAGTTQSVVDELRREISRLGLANDVLLTGGLPSGSPELIGLIQYARLFVLSSTAEPFGIVILEAWAAGTPVLSSRTSGAVSLIEHGRTGLLYDLDHTADFHSGIDTLMMNNEVHLHLCAKALERVRKDFDVTSIAGRVAKVYAELIEAKRMKGSTQSSSSQQPHLAAKLS
ncbi:glycosyltransferase family 4 protein [Prosthecobacter vanneervenii]|uniref:Glycosyltransferase involved in cell wall biosynthesis n=1 Tax=Prosthecobacter vanneervenii TaxID=48466 RepID=A0A7W7Y9Q0_9BACT|nr:glycosyltransferase family 4 protein [Prosthecobacter vanneervenii]MBB5032216.1 glycosyltransferase involved in cell wall biosynthesis [Prosthecobacter vanneervenii]